MRAGRTETRVVSSHDHHSLGHEVTEQGYATDARVGLERRGAPGGYASGAVCPGNNRSTAGRGRTGWHDDDPGYDNRAIGSIGGCIEDLRDACTVEVCCHRRLPEDRT